MAERRWLDGPWTWRDFGDGLMLTTARGGAKIVICAGRDGKLQVRDEDGVLVTITPEHPVALLLAAAPDLYEALEKAAPHLCSSLCPSVKRTDEEWSHVPECEKARAALAKACAETEVE